jgi:hypothetical protein
VLFINAASKMREQEDKNKLRHALRTHRWGNADLDCSGMAKYPQTALQRVKKKLDTNMHYD